jgi:hypothetical protein
MLAATAARSPYALICSIFLQSRSVGVPSGRDERSPQVTAAAATLEIVRASQAGPPASARTAR